MSSDSTSPSRIERLRALHQKLGEVLDAMEINPQRVASELSKVIAELAVYAGKRRAWKIAKSRAEFETLLRLHENLTTCFYACRWIKGARVHEDYCPLRPKHLKHTDQMI